MTKAFSAHPFLMISASAGSGKTYSLVRSYLQLCLAGRPDAFVEILAITFTNKAALEMRERILDQLSHMGTDPVERFNSMAVELSEILQIDPKELQRRSLQCLRKILHRYGQFQVSTIDTFNNKLIRSFSQQLNLLPTYEVELKNEDLLRDAIAELLSGLERQDPATHLVLTFIEQQLDAAKSPDIERRLFEVGMEIFNEKAQPFLRGLDEIPVADFRQKIQELRAQNQSFTQKLKSAAEEIEALVRSSAVPLEAFSYNDLGKWLGYLQDGRMDKVLPSDRLQQQLEGEKNFFNKANQKLYADSFESIRPAFDEAVQALVEWAKSGLSRYHLNAQIINELYGLAVLSQLKASLHRIMDEQNKLPIGFFNQLISEQLQEQPAEFIYEKLGERYRYFFIDEFQDTSKLQWNNMGPLINNALSQGEGKHGALLVGDAKQSIYRFRGGEVEQFIALSRDEHPINRVEGALGSVKRYDIHTEQLRYNFRSRREVVQFNNHFFGWMAQYLEDPAAAEIYRQSAQEAMGQAGGYVSIQAYPKEEVYVAAEIERILSTVERALKSGYALSDVVILVREKKHNADILTAFYQRGFALLSDTSLQLKSSEALVAAVALLRACLYSKRADLAALAAKALWLHRSKKDSQSLVEYVAPYARGKSTIQELLSSIDPNFQLRDFLAKNTLEQVVELLRLIEVDWDDAFVRHLLDACHALQLRQKASPADLLAWWDEGGSEEMVQARVHQEAVRLMSIHQSKGLEFPIVIVPFTGSALISNKHKAWYVLAEEEELALPGIPLSVSDTQAQRLGEHFAAFAQAEMRAEILSSINLLYVAFTRAKEALIVFCQQDEKGEKRTPKALQDFLQAYLAEFSPGEYYELGQWPTAEREGRKKAETLESTSPYEAVPWRSKVQKRLYKSLSTAALEAMQSGEEIHAILAEVRTLEELQALGDHSTFGPIAREMAEDEALHVFFQEDGQHFNERDLILPNGEVLRPDRVLIQGQKLWILDYKSGLPAHSHKRQLEDYCQALEGMGYSIQSALLLYLQQGLEKIYIR